VQLEVAAAAICALCYLLSLGCFFGSSGGGGGGGQQGARRRAFPKWPQRICDLITDYRPPDTNGGRGRSAGRRGTRGNIACAWNAG
jgi:hypothetical protein